MASTVLHCSDIHLLSLEGVGPLRFLNKRMTGGVNLLMKRRRRHREALFDRIVEHAHRLKVDRLIVTGDLTNLALESEYEHVRAVLRTVEVPVTVVPGNHDVYTRGAERSARFEQYLGEFMEGDRIGDAAYPFVQRLDDNVALIGLSTAVATLPMFATGSLGEGQLDRLATLLDHLGSEHCMRIVLIHHPVVSGVSHARHDLLDLDAFGAVIAKHGAELVLHGHEHSEILGSLVGPGHSVPVHGIASGTSISSQLGREGAFGLYRLEGQSILRTRYVWTGSDFEPANINSL